MFGTEQRASADRQTGRECACRVSVACWLSVCLSVCVDPFFPCDTTTPSHCSPATIACQSNKWLPIPRKTSIIICSQSRRETSGNMHLSSQSMIDACSVFEMQQPSIIEYCLNAAYKIHAWLVMSIHMREGTCSFNLLDLVGMWGGMQRPCSSSLWHNQSVQRADFIR